MNSLPPGFVENKGLEPIDFVKYTSCLEPEEVDELTSMGLGLERYSLDKNHLYEVLTEEELEKLCFQRDGKIPSYIGYTETIAKVLDIPPNFIPDGFVEAQLILCQEQANGPRSYKNFIRRLRREIEKEQVKIKKIAKKNNRFLTIDHADPDKPFVLKW